MTDRVLLGASQRTFKDCLKLATEYGTGLELQAFAYPDVLDSNWEELVDNYRSILDPLDMELAMHGPFLDMASGSPDPLIRAVVRLRGGEDPSEEGSGFIAESGGLVKALPRADPRAAARDTSRQASAADRLTCHWIARSSGVVVAASQLDSSGALGCGAGARRFSRRSMPGSCQTPRPRST